MDAAIDLPDDVLIDIFLRLDLMGKVRCQAVSKDWRRVLSTTKGLFGSLEVNVDFGLHRKQLPVSVREQSNNGTFMWGAEYISVADSLSSSFASWLARLLRSGSFTDVRLRVNYSLYEHYVPITEVQAASITAFALELATADALAPAPVLQVSIERVKDLESAQSAARLINAIDTYPARCTALEINADRDWMGASDLKVCIASLPRNVELNLLGIDWHDFHFDAATLELLGSFDSVGIEVQRVTSWAEPPDLSTLPPPRLQNLQFHVLDHDNFGPFPYLEVIQYFSSSLTSIELQLVSMFHESSFEISYPWILENTFSSIHFPNLTELSVALSFYWLPLGSNSPRDLAVEYKRSSASSLFEPQPGNAGPIQPDAPISEFLAALPPSVERVAILDERLSLHRAAICNDVACIKDLLSRGANVNVVDRFGRTPLICAISHYTPDPSIVHLLLENGADPTIYDGKYKNALQHACDTGCLALVQELLRDPRVNPRERHRKGVSGALACAERRLKRLRREEKIMHPDIYKAAVHEAEGIVAALQEASSDSMMGARADTAESEVVVG